MPIIPATGEAEAGESLEPRGGVCNEPRLCHCTPAWATERESVSKNKTSNPKTHRVTEWIYPVPVPSLYL